MSTFDYTDSLSDVQSEVVTALWYNENTRELFVCLNQTEFGYWPAYLYHGVSHFDWLSFLASPSKGHYYSTTLKRNYGPAESIGNGASWGVKEIPVGVPAADMGPVGTPKGLTYSDDALVDGIKVGTKIDASVVPAYTGDNVVQGYFPLQSVPDLDPDDEFENEWDSEPDNTQEDVSYFPLSTVDDDVNSGTERYTYEVTFFDSENPGKHLVRKVEADSIDEALEDVYEVADMLDRVFVVVKVEVRFV